MFGGNCLPKLECMDSIPFSKPSWDTSYGLDCRPTVRKQRAKTWVETQVHSKMGEPGFEHGLEGEIGKVLIFSRQWEKQCREGRIFPEQEKFAKHFEKGVRFHH